jgi:hypothetical protein
LLQYISFLNIPSPSLIQPQCRPSQYNSPPLLSFCLQTPTNTLQLAGVGTDCLINTLLFVAGVIPGHVHGFYISQTYYHRRRKVRKGRYPGGRKSFIYSERIWNGGTTNEHVRELWLREQEEKRIKEEMKLERSRSRKISRRRTGSGFRGW